MAVLARRRTVWTTSMKLLPLLLLIAASPVGAPPWRKAGDAAGFDGMRAEVQRIVDRHPEIKGSTRLCVVVETDFPRRGVSTAWVHFPAAQWLYAFGKPFQPPIEDGDEWAAASVDLKHDVVANRQAIGTSAKLQTRAYVDRIINACHRYGDTLAVERNHGR